MAKKNQYMWVYSPKKPAPPKVSAAFKAEVSAKGDEIVETILKPQCLQPLPENPRFNHMIDIYTRWFRSYFYFCAKYAVHGPNAMAPFFEAKQARMEYVGGRNFNLADMRHTGEWHELEQDLSLEECLKRILPNSHYFVC